MRHRARWSVQLGLLSVATWLLTVPVAAATVTRGPYLQQGRPTSVIVRWRTDVATDSRVRYGTNASNLGSVADNPASTTEHQVTVTGLSPNTKYYYSVGTAAAPLAGDSSYFFTTAAPAGTNRATRIWAIGDAGTGDAKQKAVRDAYAAYAGSKYTNLWLMLGDNAYSSGTDSEYRDKVFNIYDNVTPSSLPARFLRQTVLWPTIGNHDTAGQTNPPPTIPYYQIFNLPTNGEAGGLASGTEDYYSFDYANIHFVCLDSMTSSRSSTGPMLTWLANDLAATTQDWIIAFWHHPPFSHGTHNSDTEVELKEMRQNAVPILENHGVDLVLSGHSHNYERSFLIDGHYGTNSTWDPLTMLKDGGDGRVDGDGAYKKPTAGLAPREGAVYIVNGNSGNTCNSSCGALDYRAMFVSFGREEGSMVIDVNGNRLDAAYLRSNGVKGDHFTIIKGVPTAAISDVAVVEGNTGTRNAVFKVTLTNPGTSAVTMSYATFDGSAAAGSDYVAASGTLTIPTGTTSRTLSISVKGDMTTEGDESFVVTLSNATNAVIDDNQGQGTILDDDQVGQFELGAAAYNVSEAATAALVTVKRSGKIGGGSIDYATSDGSATAGSDYTVSSGTLTFGPNVVSKTISVPIAHDATHEPAETLLVRLSNAQGPGSALGPQDTAVVTITDNDAVPLLRFSAAAYGVSESGGSAVLTVKRTGGSSASATVDYATSDGSASGGQDYAATSGTLSFGPGAVATTLAVPITDDQGPEAAETFLVTLGNAQPTTGAALGTLKSATVKITDNDQGLAFTSATYAANEDAAKAIVTVKRTGGTAGTLTVDYGVTGGSASAGQDYGFASGTLVFGPGKASQTFGVTMLNDTAVEGTETVDLALSNFNPPTAQGSPAAAVLSITDNEPVFQFNIPKVTIAESASKAVITAKRTGPTTSPATVDYVISGGTATAVADYSAASSGALSFGAGKATQTLSIAIVNDTLDEPNETVALTLQNPSTGYGLGTPGTTFLTITDNDVAGKARLSTSVYSVVENAGFMTITVTRTGGMSGMATVDYATSPGPVNPAVAGTDYETTAGTLTFGLGETTQTFTVPVLDDVVADGNLSVTLTLSQPAGGLTLGSPTSAVLWLVDDE